VGRKFVSAGGVAVSESVSGFCEGWLPVASECKNLETGTVCVLGRDSPIESGINAAPEEQHLCFY